MFDNNNPYTLRKEIVAGFTHYHVSFLDEDDVRHETEVSRPVYLEFLRFVKQERNLRRWDERYIEQSDLTDEELYNRTLNQPKSIEDVASEKLRGDLLHQAIAALPRTQRRRFLLYFKFGLTYAQIAKIEGRNPASIYESVQGAVSKIKENFALLEHQPK